MNGEVIDMSERENSGLAQAKQNKNDEFYTQFNDIQRELNAYIEYDPDVFRGKTILCPCDDPEWSNFTLFFALNFSRYGLKKLISTSYANVKKKFVYKPMRNLFDIETDSEQFDESKTNTRGRILMMDHLTFDEDLGLTYDELRKNIDWEYLEGDGDFRSDEVKRLRDEADVIITNPPFSMFREFLAWILDAQKQFLIIGNINCITYKEVFPLIRDNKIWLGHSIHSGDRAFNVPDDYPLEAANCGVDENGRRFIRVKGVRWLTNLDHGLRHKPMMLMTMAQYIRHSKHKEIRGVGYRRYDNYDAIDVPYTDSIPIDYDGVMGVPITFLDKYCPEQFEILGITDRQNTSGLRTKKYTKEDSSRFNDLNCRSVIKIGDEYKTTYPRILIRRRR